MKAVIFFAIICFSNKIVLSQSLIYLPGGLDFASRILGSYSLPIRTLGFEGALRNPADYGTGLNINRIWYYSEVCNYIGPLPFNDSNLAGVEEVIIGSSVEMAPVNIGSPICSGIRVVLGSFIDNEFEPVTLGSGKHPASFNWVIGLAYLARLGDWGVLNYGLVKFIPEKSGRFEIQGFLPSRIDYGINMDIKQHLRLNLIYRNVTSYSIRDITDIKPNAYFPEEVLSSSYALYYRINDVQFSILGKLYSDHMDLEDYAPLLHIGYDHKFKFFEKQPITLEGVAQLIVGTEGRLIIEINIFGVGFQIGKNRYGVSYNIVWLPGLLYGLLSGE